MVIFVYCKQIFMREFEHTQKYPDANLIRLGVGDTSQPIPDIITSAMAEVIYLLINQLVTLKSFYFPFFFFFWTEVMKCMLPNCFFFFFLFNIYKTSS